MVLSVVAIAFAGGAGAAVTEEVQDGDLDLAEGEDGGESVDSALGDESEELTDETDTNDDVQISPTLEGSDDVEEVYITFEDPAIPATLTEREEIADFLKENTVDEDDPVVESLDGMGVDVVNTYWITNAVRATLEPSEDTLSDIASLSDVESIVEVPEYELTGEVPTEGETVFTPSDLDSDEGTWAWEQINVDEAWDQGATGEGVNLTVLDTGVDPDHPDIDLFTEDPGDPSYPGGWAEIDDDGNVGYGNAEDTQGHGTLVSGVAAAQPPDDDAEIEGVYGVAPDANLKHVRVFEGVGATDTLAGFEYAIDPDGTIQADIASMSFGAGPNVYDDTWIEPLQNARDMGVAPISSSGNDGEGEGLVGSPANIYDSISIGATTEGEGVAGFSSGWLEEADNWGSDADEDWPDEWIEPSVSAPGQDVPTSSMGGGYDEASGTSFSAPGVAGVYALMMEQAPAADITDYEDATEQTAWTPDSWDPCEDAAHCTETENGVADSRYGYGIVHAGDAVSEMNPLDSDSVLGDVTETGEVTLADVVLIEEEVAGVRGNDTEFFEFAGDLNRDDEIGLSDVVLAQEKLAGIVDHGEIDVSNVDAPAIVQGGDQIDVSADLENIGDIGALEDIEFRFAPEGEPLDEDSAIDERFVDMAAPGVEDPVADPSEIEIEFANIPTDGLPGGEYDHGIFSDDHESTDTITINAPFFEVTDLDAPDEADRDEEITVTAEIENTGNIGDTQDIEFRFNDLATAAAVEEDVTLQPDQSTEVTFDVTVDEPAGEYDHGVFTDDDDETATISVLEPFFEIDDIGAPELLEPGEEYTLNTTIENTGGAAGEQNVSYSITEDVDVAVVGNDPDEIPDDLEDTELNESLEAATGTTDTSPDDLVGIDAIADILDDRLGDHYDIDTLYLEDIEDDSSIVGDYDVHVVNDLGDELGPTDNYIPPSLHLQEEWKDELDDDQGVVYLDSGSIDEGNAVQVFSLDNTPIGAGYIDGTPNPSDTEATSADGDDLVLEVQEDHDIFRGLGTAGSEVTVIEDDTFQLWFPAGALDGQVLADGRLDGESNPTIGYTDTDGQTEIFYTVGGINAQSDLPEQFTDDGLDLLANMVTYLGPASDDRASETVHLEDGESKTVEFEETLDDDFDPGNYAHEITTDDDLASTPLQVTTPEQINIAELDAPETIDQGEHLNVTATLEHVGGEESTQDIEYVFDGDVEDSVEVTMEPDETKNVTFGKDIGVDFEPDVYEHGVEADFDEEFAEIEVIEVGEAFFEVTDFEAPDEAEAGSQIPVSANVTNTGDLDGTQTVEYDFDVDVPGLTPLDVAVVDFSEDGTRGAGFVEDLLDDELGEDDTVTGYWEDDVSDWEDSVTDSEHNVYVFHSVDEEESHMDFFLDNRDDDTTAVMLDSWGTGGQSTADAIHTLSDVTGDPEQMEDQLDGTQNAYMNAEQDHPIFDGVVDEGDSFRVMKDDEVDEGTFASMHDFSGEQIATGSFGGGDSPPNQPVSVVDYDRGLVLQSMLGNDVIDIDEFYEDAHQIIVNSVEYAGSGELTQSATAAESGGVTLEDEDDELSVAMVELAHTGGGTHVEDVDEILSDRLEDATLDRFYQDEIDGGQDSDAWEDQLNDYDVHVVQNWGPDNSDVGTEHVEYFVDNVDSTTAAVLLDSRNTGSTLNADGVRAIGDETGDPGIIEDEFNTDVGAWITPEEDHPIFDGIADEGESALIANADNDLATFSTFDDTGATEIGSVSFGEEGGTIGSIAAVDHERQLVFQSALGGDIMDPADFADDGKDLLANSVEFAASELVGEGETVISLDPGESQLVEFNVTIPDTEADEYGHGIFSENDSDVAPITVTEPDEENFQLSNLDPEDAEVETDDDPIDVDVDVDNEGTQAGTQNLTLEVVDDDTEDVVFDATVEDVSLDPNETQTVTFEDVPANTLDRGDYTHTVASEDDDISGSLTVVDPVFFQVSNLDAPGEIGSGEEIDVSADVTNTVPPTDEVTVAVVDNDIDTDALEASLIERGYSEDRAADRAEMMAERQADSPHMADALADFLDDELHDDYIVQQINADDLMDYTDHDVYVVNHFGDTDVGDFYDELDDTQAAIHLDQWEDSESNAVVELEDEFSDPGDTDRDFDGSGADLHINEDHPLFDGIGEDGDVVGYHDSPEADRLWFDDYSGDVLADISDGGGDPDGAAIGVNDDDNQILLASSGRTGFTGHDDFTDDEHTLMINAVEYAADEYVGLAAMELPDATATQDVEFRFDGDMVDSQEVTLDADQTKTVDFEDVEVTADPGEYEHGVFSDDDNETAMIDVGEGAEYELSNLDPEDAEVSQGDDPIDVEVDVENVGDSPGTQDITLEVVEDDGDEPPEPVDADIAVVNPEEDDSVSYLIDDLEAQTGAEVDFVEHTTLFDDIEGYVDDYDSFVAMHYEDDIDYEDDIIDFLDEVRSTDDTGLVNLDPNSEEYGWAFGGSIWALGLVDADPGSLTEIGTDADDPLEVQIEEDHTLFDGVGDEGDSFDIRADDGASQAMVQFDDYSGTDVGSAVEDGEVGDSIAAISDDEDEVLLGLGADGDEQHFEDHTDDAMQVIVNSLGFVTDELDATTLGATPEDVAFSDTIEDVEVGTGDTETVTFPNVPVGTLDAGSYEHTVFSEDDEISGTLTVDETDFFEVSDLDAPDDVVQGEEINVSATVENTSPPVVDGIEVTVVKTEVDDGGVMEDTDAAYDTALGAFLSEDLDDEEFVVQEITPDELPVTTNSDIYVIQEFGGESADSFLSQLDDDQGVVHLDQKGDDVDGVSALVDEFGDPGEVDSDFAGGPDTHFEITNDHALFDGIGEEGETFTYHEGFDADRLWFDDYSGEVLGEIEAADDSVETGGPAVGVNEDDNQVLLPSSARTHTVIHDEFTDKENTLMINAIEYVAEEAGHFDDASTLDDAETQDIEFRLDGDVVQTQEVTLEPDQSKTVEFENIEVTVDPGEYEHGVFSEDDQETATIEVLEDNGVESVGLLDSESPQITTGVGTSLSGTAVLTG